MTWPSSWHAPDWWIPAAIVAVVALPMVFRSNWSRRLSLPVKLFLTVVKSVALGLLALCLLEPMHSLARPKPGANSIVVMADASQSLQVKDEGQSRTRAEVLKSHLDENAEWLAALDEQFELRRYRFDSRVNAVTDFQDYQADGVGSAIENSLKTVGQRLQGQGIGKPSAGIILLTDGNSSERSRGLLADSFTPDYEMEWDRFPPIYPVIVGSERPPRDVSIIGVETSQTNFESAPVTIKTELMTHGYAGETVKVELLGPDDQSVEVQEVRRVEDGRPFAVRFQLKPTDRGVNEFRVRAWVGDTTFDDISEQPQEATMVNNQRVVLVDRGRGPFRILYVAGRPNWEYKFLRRAIADDEELDLVGLLRVARKEPKFSFRGRAGTSTNPLYRGFGNQGDATAEQYDEPVLIRLDTRDDVELRDGFPKDAATLFAYDAMILDDVESRFFTEDQKTLLSQFVSLRGGGFLMLGGMDSFASGGFAKTRIGEMLPVYLDQPPAGLADSDYQLALSREGWIQPWIRLESTRDREEQRLADMPGFRTLNITNSIKPGASVLAHVRAADKTLYPALVVQRFGKGRTAALLIGDMWRWKMKSPQENVDLYKSWRQTLRWLVAEVPRRVEVEVEPSRSGSSHASIIAVQVFDETYQPQLNSEVKLIVTTPSGKQVTLTADQSAQKAGRYQTTFASRETGAYRVTAIVDSPEGNLIEKRVSGWVSDVAADEFRSLVPNREFLKELAVRSGGQLVEIEDLAAFAGSFQNRKVPISETRAESWWHRWWVFLTAMCLLVVEWGTRRVAGLA